MGDLHILAQNGNIKGIRAALKNKKAFLSLDEDLGWSPLHYASNCSKAKAVQVILEAGISPNIKSSPLNTTNKATGISLWRKTSTLKTLSYIPWT